MFKRILIANRGEIACRIIKTARRMGIATVAVYSEADRDALHVKMADTAVLIGPPPASQSYLVIENIVAACKTSGAEAVHPGYGFLSERAAFADALGSAGIVFIGPNADAIRAMGDKIESKKAAARANVSTVPGHLGVIADHDEAIAIAWSWSSITPRWPGTVETWARAAAFFDSILSPMAAIALGFGPMKTMPALASASANASRSDKKP